MRVYAIHGSDMRCFVYDIIFFSTLTLESKEIYKLFVDCYFVFYYEKVGKNESIWFSIFYGA